MVTTESKDPMLNTLSAIDINVDQQNQIDQVNHNQSLLYSDKKFVQINGFSEEFDPKKSESTDLLEEDLLQNPIDTSQFTYFEPVPFKSNKSTKDPKTGEYSPTLHYLFSK
jgi:hypothetical protein